KPVVLASPLSAAQFLPPDFPKFDLVVIDEASQVPVWDAACALSRGRNAVVVGDSKQLPPTSFFDVRSSEDSEEELEEGEQHESVLDGCSGAGIPELSLLWHYRSRDERLIEFANRRSYGASLQTFPAPARSHPDLGVEFRLVKGVYDRAGTATNDIEARAVVEEAMRRLRSEVDVPANRSIGIVTFSVAQQKRVADLLDLALDADEMARKNREKAAQQGEDVFVKNLESVQGDERATMLFSIGYGPDAAGRIHYNFGPLGTSGGERRLNVAITRAKEKVIVFASMRASQLDPARCRSRGVQDLRSYLEYAELGVVPSTPSESGTRREVAVSALERELAEALRQRGWHVDTHVGRSRDYRISLALADARTPERWVLGVELDGLHWAIAPTTLDREAVRGSVLSALGWTILPVATLDCWRDLPRVVETIDAAARAARDARS
ncbi:MAG: AAA domain-containing protein, partial [Planctomycetota bacterium]